MLNGENGRERKGCSATYEVELGSYSICWAIASAAGLVIRVSTIFRPKSAAVPAPRLVMILSDLTVFSFINFTSLEKIFSNPVKQVACRPFRMPVGARRIAGEAHIAAISFFSSFIFKISSFTSKEAARFSAPGIPPGKITTSGRVLYSVNSMSVSIVMPCAPFTDFFLSPAIVTSMPARRSISAGVTASISSNPSANIISAVFFIFRLLFFVSPPHQQPRRLVVFFTTLLRGYREFYQQFY